MPTLHIKLPHRKSKPGATANRFIFPYVMAIAASFSAGRFKFPSKENGGAIYIVLMKLVMCLKSMYAERPKSLMLHIGKLKLRFVKRLTRPSPNQLDFGSEKRGETWHSVDNCKIKKSVLRKHALTNADPYTHQWLSRIR